MMAYARAVLVGSGRDAPGAYDDASRRDIVQQVFCAMLRDRAARSIEDPAAYLFRATRNAALNHARGHARGQARERAWALEGGVRGGGAVAGGGDAGGSGPEDLLAALARVDEDAREVILLKHVAGLTFDQMGLALGMARGTVASRYAAALKTLRACLSASVAGAEPRAEGTQRRGGGGEERGVWTPVRAEGRMP
jgi:RNA polymerase sigma-70 factor (ECF subfamily)